MNAAFMEISKDNSWDCYIFNDVDLLPERDGIPYRCTHNPVHLSVAVNTLGYRLMYDQLFGGVIALTPHHFTLVNGFSNCYFGWGAEDDDMYIRVKSAGLNITRYPKELARFTMTKHQKEKGSNER